MDSRLPYLANLPAVLILTAAACALPRAPVALRVLATGETHAMLEPCDCPDEPRGGLSRRATVLGSFNVERRLLVDAGGFSAGGLYDTYTEGHVRDSARTRAVVSAMARMRYDAVAVGDEELQWGGAWLADAAERDGLPLVCANCLTRGGDALFPAYRLVKKDGLVFGIAGLAPSERLLATDSLVTIVEPMGALRALWSELVGRSDYQVVLAHLGEDAASEIARSFPECDLVVNGHRKVNTSAVLMSGACPVMQFGFQGKKVAYADVTTTSDGLEIRAWGWIPVDSGLPADPDVQGLVRRNLDPLTTGPARTRLDLYMMGQCPYCMPVLSQLLALSETFPCMDLDLWFIGTARSDGSLESMRGESEIEEEMTWLAVRELYPRQWRDFLYLRGRAGLDAGRAIGEMGLDTTLISRWISVRGRAALETHYRRSERLGVKASPTVLWNNTPFEFDSLYFRAARKLCESCGEGVGVCRSLSECLHDADCHAEGKSGVCVKHEDVLRCAYRDAVPFEFVAVTGDSLLWHSEAQAIATTRSLFPGANVSVVGASTARGRQLVDLCAPASLPLYLFDTLVAGALNFPKVEPGLVRCGDWLTFKDGIMGRHYFHKRERRPGTVAIIVDPTFPGLGDVVRAAVARDSGLAFTHLWPALPPDDGGAEALPDTLRRAEALRWLVMARHYPREFVAYVGLCGGDTGGGTDNWRERLARLNIEPGRVEKLVAREHDLLPRHMKVLAHLGVADPVQVFVENREMVPANSPDRLGEVLKMVPRPASDPGSP